MYYTITPSAHVSVLQQVFDCRDIFELKPYGDTRSSQSAGFDFYIKRSIDFETNNKFQVQLLAQVSKPSHRTTHYSLTFNLSVFLETPWKKE